MSKYTKLEDAISKIVNTPTRVITDDLTALADRQHEIIDMLADLPTIEVMEYPQVEGITPTLVTPEVSEDCISREYILGEAFMSDEYNRETKSFDLPVVSVRDIEDAPSVVPIRAEGEWEVASDNDGEYGICSLCGNDADFTHYGKAYHYCPNCGAKMKGAEE